MSSIDFNVALPAVLRLAELALELRAQRPGGHAATAEELAAIQAVRARLQEWPSRVKDDPDGEEGNGPVVEDADTGEAQED